MPVTSPATPLACVRINGPLGQGRAGERPKALRGREQTPFFDAATEDFPVALLRGGKGLPKGGWTRIKDTLPRAGLG